MIYKLFIDDERFPVSGDWTIVRSSGEAIQVVKKQGIPIEIAFDHDLGIELGVKEDVRPFIFWLGNYMFDKFVTFPEGFKYSVHSQNPVGAAWIKAQMDSLIQSSQMDDEVWIGRKEKP